MTDFYHDTNAFPIGLCEYPAQIKYTLTSEGEVEVSQCQIEITGRSDNQHWATVPDELNDEISKRLQEELDKQVDEPDYGPVLSLPRRVA